MDKRRSYRFDKVFAVNISSTTFGDSSGIARNISAGGMFLEVSDPLPLGSEVKVHFAMPDSDGEFVACGEVKRHFFFNYADDGGPRTMTGMGVRFTRFERESEADLERNLGRMHPTRTLH